MYECPVCHKYFDLSDLCIGKGEYGEYLEEKFECPHCNSKLIATTECINIIKKEK